MLDERKEQLVLNLVDELNALRSSLNVLMVQVKELNENLRELKRRGESDFG